MRRVIEEVEEPRHRSERPLVRLLLAEEPQHRLSADHPDGKAVVVLPRYPVRPDELRGGHGLQLAATAMEDELDVRERLQAGAEARHRLPYALRHGADPAVRLCVEVEDAIGFSEPDRPEHHGFRAVCPSGHAWSSLGTSPGGERLRGFLRSNR